MRQPVNSEFNSLTAPILDLYTDERPIYPNYVIDSERPIQLPEIIKPQVAPPVVVSAEKLLYNDGFGDVNPDIKPFAPDVFAPPIIKRPKPAVYVDDAQLTPIAPTTPAVAAKKPFNPLYIVGAVVAIFIIYKLIK